MVQSAHSVERPDSLALKLYKRRWLVIVAGVAIMCLILLCTWLAWPRTVRHLNSDATLARSGLIGAWNKGNIIVLVRHAERCDRSSSACLGDADGITQDGLGVATTVGKALQSLGIERTDVLSSTATRGMQTTQAMFSQPVAAQDWLYSCINRKGTHDLLATVATHKNPERNLVLITHSQCIDAVEMQLGIRSSQTTVPGYVAALFVRVNEHGSKPRLVGYANAADWASMHLPDAH